MITADMITDEQIRELRRGALQSGDGSLAWFAYLALGGSVGTTTNTYAARARCAEILNARAKEAK